ncbi:glycerophosphodiester phosphodiesterase family protein [Spirosoma sp. BT702]|uniref:Glycerophosphodiester phosphodiesterase family protein n=1 Tax=Spirosoma profusum TaxID=2771354 RepID=A0A926XTG2_9BACT|nr:glycerophosphodiester phosphodiesterase family protein [Spirosoma profusum]MBD2699444.1 glycerophosphodiester phosphodiesterase family protein [Spirosoma profusum]
MKKSVFVCLLCLVVQQSLAQQIDRFRDIQALDEHFQPKPDRKHPLILAHRGGPGQGDTENSITTFDKTAIALPDAIIEMDVRMTQDSTLVLLHDATLNRESDAKGNVAEWTFNNLKKIRLKTLAGELTNERIPTFADVLNWNQNRYVLALDVKPGTDLLRTMKEVQKYGAEHSVFVICYSPADAQRMRKLYPNLWLALGVSGMSDVEKWEINLPVSGRLIALTPQKLQESAFYERLHKLGILCSVGTYGAGQLDEMPIKDAASGYRNTFRQGGDILTTDRPKEVADLF